MAVVGHELQIVKVLADHTYELDEKLLEQALLKESVKDLPVVLVSVAGAFRRGKSFLLNFFLRYLSASQSARIDGSWLGTNTAPLTGFNWRGGSQRNTTGIIMWSEPFVSTLPNGEKVAVLVMDTQGTFDSKSTIRDNSTIFALSTLVSSVQIYNLSMNIQEDDLQHLQLFTSYGKMVQEKNLGGKPFQTLEFLVRDWPYQYEYPFGVEGGKQFLQQKLEVTSDQPQELKDLRNHIRGVFEEVLCFLMPHPGFKVLNPAFTGNITDIETDFKTYLNQLVPSLLSEAKLRPKTINGQRVKAGELFNYFKAYMTLFNSDQIPSPRNILQATAEAGLLSSLNEARVVYEKGMEEECGPSKPGVPPNFVSELHRQNLAAARSAFTNKKTLATQDEVHQKLNILSAELENRLPIYEQNNLSKLLLVIIEATNVYEQKIRDVHKDKPLCLSSQDLDAVHNDAMQAAFNKYDGRVKKVPQKLDQKRDELAHSLNVRLGQLRQDNDKNNKDVIRDVTAEYWRFMESKSVEPPISDNDFRNAHNVAFNQALANFQAKKNRPSSNANDLYKEELTKTINDTFWRLDAVNKRKIELERVKQEQERIRIEQERITAEQARIRIEQEKIKAEQEKRRLEEEKQKAEKERAEQEKRRIEEERIARGSSCSSSEFWKRAFGKGNLFNCKQFKNH